MGHFIKFTFTAFDKDFSAMAMPTAFANPWPKGPVVVSTPGVISHSG